MSSDLGTHFTDYNVQQWAERCFPQSNSLVEKQNGQLRHWFFKVGGYKGMKGWLKCLHQRVHTFSVNGAKGVSPLDIPQFFSGPGEKEVGGYLYVYAILAKVGKTLV